MRTALVLVLAACGGSSSPPPRATPLPPPPDTAPPPAAGGAPAPPNMPVVIGSGDAACEQSKDCMFYTRSARDQHPAPGTPAQPYGPDRTFQPIDADSVLVQIKAGTQPFWHMHRHDAHLVVLAGTVEFLQSGAGVHSLEPGSYVRQPGGYKHTERCTSATDCVVYIHSDHGFDVKPL